MHHSVSGQFAIRKGRWKLIEGAGNGDYPRDAKGRMAVKTRTPRRGADGKFVELDYFGLPPTKSFQLFDLQKDPGEKNDVSSEHSEKVKELSRLLDGYRASGRST